MGQKLPAGAAQGNLIAAPAPPPGQAKPSGQMVQAAVAPLGTHSGSVSVMKKPGSQLGPEGKGEGEGDWEREVAGEKEAAEREAVRLTVAVGLAAALCEVSGESEGLRLPVTEAVLLLLWVAQALAVLEALKEVEAARVAPGVLESMLEASDEAEIGRAHV